MYTVQMVALVQEPGRENMLETMVFICNPLFVGVPPSRRKWADSRDQLPSNSTLLVRETLLKSTSRISVHLC